MRYTVKQWCRDGMGNYDTPGCLTVDAPSDTDARRIAARQWGLAPSQWALANAPLQLEATPEL